MDCARISCSREEINAASRLQENASGLSVNLRWMAANTLANARFSAHNDEPRSQHES
jgi:hypothetical protein